MRSYPALRIIAAITKIVTVLATAACVGVVVMLPAGSPDWLYVSMVAGTASTSRSISSRCFADISEPARVWASMAPRSSPRARGMGVGGVAPRAGARRRKTVCPACDVPSA